MTCLHPVLHAYLQKVCVGGLQTASKAVSLVWPATAIGLPSPSFTLGQMKPLFALTLALATVALAQTAPKLSQTQVLGYGTVSMMKPSPDGQRLASVGGRGLVVWDAKTGQATKVIDIPDFTRSLDWAGDGKTIVTGSDDGVVRVWNPETGQGSVLVSNLDSLYHLGLSRNGKFLAVITGERLRLFDTKTTRLLANVALGEYGGYSLAWSADSGTVAAGGDNDLVTLLNTATLKSRSFKGHEDDVTAIAFSPDGKRLATSADDDTLRFWDVASGKQTGKTDVEDGASALAWSADGKRLAANTNYGVIEVWDSTGKAKSSLAGHQDSVRSLAFTSDGRLYSASDDQSIRQWNVAAKQTSQTLVGHVPWLNSLMVAGDTVVAGSYYNDVSVLFRRQTGELFASYQLNRSGTTTLATSPDGKLLASADEDNVRLIDIATGRQQAILDADGSTVYSLAWHPGGAQLIAGLSDGTLLMWDVVTGKVVAELKTHNDTVHALYVMPDGNSLYTASDDGTVRVFELSQ
jgi:WD40 repeat protein